MKLNKKIVTPVIIFLLIFIGLEINVFFKSKECFQSSYHLIIDKVEDGGRGTELLYSKGKRINLIPYSTYYAKIGDSISKDYCAKYVYFYRKDSLGNYYEHAKLEPISIFFPRSWFCKDFN